MRVHEYGVSDPRNLQSMWDVIIAPYVEVGINHSHAKLRLFQFIQSIVIVNYLPVPLLREQTTGYQSIIINNHSYE